MGRYLRLLSLQLRTSVLLAAQYRGDFVLDGGLSIVWASTAVAPLFMVYGAQRSIPGWSPLTMAPITSGSRTSCSSAPTCMWSGAATSRPMSPTAWPRSPRALAKSQFAVLHRRAP